MRTWLLVPVVVLGVLVMHGFADAGATDVPVGVEHLASSHHAPSGPQHSGSHLAVMGLCTFALLAAAHQVVRDSARRRPPLRLTPSWTGRVVTGPEPPVPRVVV